MPNVSELISHILLKKLREEELTPQEVAALAEWEGRSPEHAEFISMLMDEAALSDKIKSMLELDEQAAWQRIEKALSTEWNERAPQKRRISFYRIAVAASVIFLLGFGIIYFITRKTPVSEESGTTKPATVADIAPGGNRAELFLADGSIINLDTAANGELANEDGSKVMKMADGRISYEREGGQGVVAAEKHNTLKTPRAGEYLLLLPDGSKVWLNAASKIKYPVAFAGPERKIEISGEAYFEVAKDANKKFIAVIKNEKGDTRGEIEVLGTHFNVKAYDEENVIETTLAEGKIKMAAAGGADSKILLRGQQAQLGLENTLKVVDNVDVDAVLAWKNGVTTFESIDSRTILRAIGRWYDVDVVFIGDVPTRTGIHGSVERNTSMTTLIQVLRTYDINCALENGKLVVRPGKPKSE